MNVSQKKTNFLCGFKAAAALSGKIVFGLGSILPLHAAAAEPAAVLTNVLSEAKSEWTSSLRWENDTFGGSDRFYTDGISIGFSQTGKNWMDPLAECLPWGEGRRTVGYDLSQGMFTPSDIDRTIPDPNDRPYGGVITFGLSLHVEKERSFHGLKLLSGFVGSVSLAEETQNAVHELIGNDKAQGWDYQLKNEPVFNLVYEYRRKYPLLGERKQWSAEALSISGGWVGNLLTQGQLGALLRAGYNMPEDFGPTLARGMSHTPPPRHDPDMTKSDWGFSFYGGGLANVVLRDIMLDGNTFTDSPSVDKKWVVPMAGVGSSFGNRQFQISFSYIFWGKEFDGQEQHAEFGALTISYFF
ncbi:MAG: lipid A deacylase LpxR family protein [Verrucomicrobiota bacterium]|nr:lipid A deacylase LpxR family protein [Verrucomicrobiota bacterium]